MIVNSAPCPLPPASSALRALLEWEKGRAFSDEILHTLLERIVSRRSIALSFMETFFGILRNLSRLDFLIARLREGALDDGNPRRPAARALPDLPHAHRGACGGE